MRYVSLCSLTYTHTHTLQLLGCRVHDCARQGLAIFGGGAELMADLNLDLSLDTAVDPGLLTGMTGGVVQVSCAWVWVAGSVGVV